MLQLLLQRKHIDADRDQKGDHPYHQERAKSNADSPARPFESDGTTQAQRQGDQGLR